MHKLEIIIIIRILQTKSGVVRTAARELVCLPTSFMGFGLLDLWTAQLVEHITVLLEHGNQKSLTGDLLRSLAQGHYIEAGLGGDLFLWDVTKIPWIT
jgi:hypothetical protein